MKKATNLILSIGFILGASALATGCDLTSETMKQCTVNGTVQEVDTATDKNNCGACDKKCDGDDVCINSVCTKTNTDPNANPNPGNTTAKEYKYIMVTDTSDVAEILKGKSVTNTLVQDIGVDIDAIGVKKASGDVKWAKSIVNKRYGKRGFVCNNKNNKKEGCAEQSDTAVLGAPDAITTYKESGKKTCNPRKNDGKTQTYFSMGGYLKEDVVGKDAGGGSHVFKADTEGAPFLVVDLEDNATINNGDEIYVVEIRNCENEKSNTSVETKESAKISVAVSHGPNAEWKDLGTIINTSSDTLGHITVAGL